jgi:hypothetical protein
VTHIERALAKTRGALIAALLPFVGTFGCSSSDSSKDPGAPGSPQPPSEGEWRTLLTGDWTVPPGGDDYTCVRKTMTEDLYVNGFEAISPRGTHHTLLTVGEPTEPDGLTLCNAGTNRTHSVYGSGVGPERLEFPAGVAMKIPKGTQLLLNLHLFNIGGADISGTSGTLVRVIAESQVETIAEGVLAGTIAINIPPQQTATTTGWCTMSSKVTLFAVAPHMHQLGVYEKVTAESSSQGEVPLFDGPYNFDDQSYHLIEPLDLAKGDRVRVECTHKNTTNLPVGFGESTLSEMCFAGMYRYPADGSPFICVDRPSP